MQKWLLRFVKTFVINSFIEYLENNKYVVIDKFNKNPDLPDLNERQLKIMFAILYDFVIRGLRSIFN